MSDPAASPSSGPPVYRGMDRAALDAAYNNSAAVADSPRWLAEWESRSQPFRALAEARLDLAYGTQPRERLDYLPSGRARAPLLVFIHGGYWLRNSKEMFAFTAGGPLAHGIDVALLGYTLAPAARLADMVAEVTRAISFLAASADELGFDRDRIFAGGWSAGGHLAALAALRQEVRGALAISGLFDLEPVALTYVNETVHLDRHEIETLSPQYLLHAGMAPIHVAIGDRELPELKRQSFDFHAAAAARGLPVTARALDGHHHYSILDELARPDGALATELVRLMSRAG